MANYRENKAEAIRKLGKIIDSMKRYPKTEEMEALILELDRIRDGKSKPEIKPLMLYVEVIDSIRQSTVLPSALLGMIHNAEAVYNDLFVLGEKTPDFDNTVAIFKGLIGVEGLIARGLFDLGLYSTFSDKTNYLCVAQVISNLKDATAIFNKIRNYGLEAREYFVEDTGYLANLLKVIGRLNATRPSNYEAAMENELANLRKNNGIYDVDPVRLAEVEKNVSRAELTIESGKNMLELLDRKCQTLKRVTDEMDGKSKVIQKNMSEYLDSKTENAKTALENAMKECEEIQRKSILMEKDLFLKQMFSEAESELTKYKSQAKAITATASADVAAIGRDADGVIKRLRKVAEDDDKIQKFVENSRMDEAILQKIEKLTMLNDSMIERLQKDAADVKETEAPARQETEQAPPKSAKSRSEEYKAAVSGAGAQTSVQVSSAAAAKKEHRIIPPVNPLLDRSIPFTERYAMVQAEKTRRMEQGEIFHEAFDDVITAVMENVNPYLIGPSGCGKTFMVNQIGEILNLDCSDIGYINEEYDILGYVTAMGDYSESNFYRLYKYGGIAFCDELDNGNAKATVKLNSFLSNQERSNYCFPGGERVERHANFRVIAAGNTDGSGADVNYSTREKIEESVQQRMIPVYVDYDNRVEEAILANYPDWFEFACAFRKATDRWEEACGVPAQGIFTTRDAFRIKRYMDDTSFTPQKIMNYEFVQTKEPEYLGFLKEELAKLIKKGDVSYGIYQIFSSEVERIRKRGKRR